MSGASFPIHLAVDVGASGGRVLAGGIDNSTVLLEEIHRFDNGPHSLGKRLVWNLLGLWEEIQIGLQKAAHKFSSRIISVGVDTWGVDYVLLDKNEDLIGPAFSYRDPRTAGVMQQAFQRISRSQIFDYTGLQFMELNTAYQLFSMRLESSPLLEIADRFLMIPDFLHWQLSGQQCNEFTNASTTQLLDPTTGQWCRPLIDALDLPSHIFLPPVQPGEVLGKITRRLAERTHLSPNVDVILPASHDTGSAVLAVPAIGFAREKPDWCYISCGTWSLMGVETASPNLTPTCQQFNFTNEGGVGGSTRLLKNISGLWIVQQCRQQWAHEGRVLGWSELSRMAGQAPSMVAVIDPDDPSFAAPENMPQAIRDYCRRTSQSIPSSEGAIIRCALESLALRYRMVLEMLEELVGHPLTTIHMVGGGVRNTLLCQFAANACNRPVIAGPVEATAIGNVLVQAIGSGQIQSIDQARQLVRHSPEMVRYTPQSDSASMVDWSKGLEMLKRLAAGG